MSSVVVVFPKMEDAKSIRNLLVRNGIEVAGICTTGGQALDHMDSLGGGIVVCGYRFQDMLYTELREQMGGGFEMLLLASQRVLAERAVIERAKALLMERNHMTEEEAHRYVQKCSMDSGNSIVETAQMIISLL